MAIEQFTGTAYTDETMQTVLYKERHLVMHNDRGEPSHSMVLYSRPDEGPKVFANLRSDFTRGRNVSVYEFHDYALKWKEGITYEDGRYVMYRGEGELPLEKKELSMDASNLFAGEGWHYFLLDKLDMLAQKARKPTPFVLHLCFPAHLANYPFVLKREWLKGSLLRMSLSFKSFLISFFAPKIFVTYDVVRKKLLSFSGPSNVYDEKGKLQNVHIVYNPEEEGKAACKAS